MRNSKAGNLVKAAMLIRSHENDLGNFFVNDPKGKQLPEYLSNLGEHLTKEHEEVLKELGSLASNIIHIKEIVAMQQSYAKTSGLLEKHKPAELVEDALRMNLGAVNRHKISVVREFNDVPPVMTDKHKVLQILVNLIRNAKYACDDSGKEDKQIKLKVWNGDGLVKIAVIDNGIGIAPENLTRIFNHGFTTRKEGHGFGLHSGANAAQELKGKLTAASEGLGHGASFILELPVNQQENHS
jgi:signal transduction histidine kinase